ncbi:MAG: precorrin-6Y C5,15-methyltransferase (decarboxylating) subunit CbiT [Bacillota bacterium]|nr:precorrin-6Y C5,15-methyltransferase (decarboxylating) subunit CbiT [Bacillota bacterium]
MWIKDQDFIRGQVPMTKFAVRSLIIADLEIRQGDRFLDIGCGTGSISVEAASHGAQVIAVDKNPEAVALTKENGKKFGQDILVLEKNVPEGLEDFKINKCFVGGSTGKLADIFAYLDRNLEEGGILVGSFILLKNLGQFKELLKEHGYKNIETKLVQVAIEDKIGLMKGENPIFIVKGVK